jgi:hypothetical protein
MFPRRIMGTTLVVVVALLPVGCGASTNPTVSPTESIGAPDEPDGRFDTPSEVRAQLPAALKAFDGTFPRSVETSVLTRLQKMFDTQHRAVAADEDGHPGVYEHGYAEVVVLDYWMCSWENTYLAAREREDSAAMDRAAAELDTWYDLGYAKKWVEDPDRNWEAEVLEPALRGDIKAMAAELRSCPNISS